MQEAIDQGNTPAAMILGVAAMVTLIVTMDFVYLGGPFWPGSRGFALRRSRGSRRPSL